VLTVSSTRTCSGDVWNTAMELVRTRFHGSIIFHKDGHVEPLWPVSSVYQLEVRKIHNAPGSMINMEFY
jgi:hypothetical protein